ncbi:putative Protein tyrosine phosphatase-like protein, PTPLA [Monocercomonoides exilis]|uniref:putative Protein tyrosine phosphatase-like protein, PTPLA n=1 Tax=Monocercomonoides exilis TaxID=2049356 RepID=UPI003559E6A7|nr:putative Protein tyrosine phosphatase-like protein, PTPLA [Monocercomonoides exilis]
MKSKKDITIKQSFFGIYYYCLLMIWIIVFILTLHLWKTNQNLRDNWKPAFKWCFIGHMVMWTKMVFAAFGVIDERWKYVLMQMLSKTLVCPVITSISADYCIGWWTPMLLLSWSLSEILNNGFSVLEILFDNLPAWLIKLRYSSFHILTITSFVGEAFSGIYAMQYLVPTREIGVTLPNRFNACVSGPFIVHILLPITCFWLPSIYNYQLHTKRKYLKLLSTSTLTIGSHHFL